MININNVELNSWPRGLVDIPAAPGVVVVIEDHLNGRRVVVRAATTSDMAATARSFIRDGLLDTTEAACDRVLCTLREHDAGRAGEIVEKLVTYGQGRYRGDADRSLFGANEIADLGQASALRNLGIGT